MAKMLVQRYRREVVRPALQAADREWFAERLTEYIPGTDICFSDLSAEIDNTHLDLLQLEYYLQDWMAFRMWAVYRSSGCFPGHGLGGERYGLIEMDRCTLCGKGRISPAHILLDCRGTSRLFSDMGLESVYPGRRPRRDCLHFLLAMTTNWEVLATNIKYVGNALKMARKESS